MFTIGAFIVNSWRFPPSTSKRITIELDITATHTRVFLPEGNREGTVSQAWSFDFTSLIAISYVIRLSTITADWMQNILIDDKNKQICKPAYISNSM